MDSTVFGEIDSKSLTFLEIYFEIFKSIIIVFIYFSLKRSSQ